MGNRLFVCRFLAVSGLHPKLSSYAETNPVRHTLDEMAGSFEINRQKHHGPLNAPTEILMNQSAVMFWRPQKVGSSTIMSLLISFGYRHNVLTRRRSPITNSVCIKIAACALHASNSSVGGFNSGQSVTELQTYLQEYLDRRSYARPHNGKMKPGSSKVDANCESESYRISTSHQLCNLRSEVVKSSLQCTFSQSSNGYKPNQRDDFSNNRMEPVRSIKEIFVVRNPLSRAISIYYFWGELFKMHKSLKRRAASRQMDEREKAGRRLLRNDTETGAIIEKSVSFFDNATRDYGNRRLSAEQQEIIRLGSSAAETVHGNLFTYHGDEKTVPPLGIAMAFAKVLRYTAGMPGPSFTWSAFASSPQSAIREVRSDRMMTIITERMEESLVVASYYLEWSLADIVVTAARKVLSTHPKHTQWPPVAIEKIRSSLRSWGEDDVYDAANTKLNERIQDLTVKGANITADIESLRIMKARVTKLCMSEEYLVLYRDKLAAEGYKQHKSNNKLRDSDEKFSRDGHCFSSNGEIMYSYDICGSCEAHAMIFAVKSGLSKDLESSPVLANIDRALIRNNPTFAKCA